MARELIDRKQISYTWWQHQDGTFSDGVTLQSVIHRMPVIDAVEVIRCKDCDWYDTECESCNFWGGVRHPEHYCGEGERKDNGSKT